MRFFVTNPLGFRIETAELEDDSVTTPKIANDAVNSAKLENNAVQTAKIQNMAVETAKLDNKAATGAKIADNAVDTLQLAAMAVETAQLGNLAVTTGKIADDGVTLSKMASGTIGNFIGYDGSGDPADLAAPVGDLTNQSAFKGTHSGTSESELGSAVFTGLSLTAKIMIWSNFQLTTGAGTNTLKVRVFDGSNTVTTTVIADTPDQNGIWHGIISSTTDPSNSEVALGGYVEKAATIAGWGTVVGGFSNSWITGTVTVSVRGVSTVVNGEVNANCIIGVID